MFENHWDEADWFMKADDDTFVVVENLKHLLKDFNTNDPIGFGHNFKYLGVRKIVFCVGNDYCLFRDISLVVLAMFCLGKHSGDSPR